MGNEQKDRLGDKLRDLEHAREEKFFAEREKEALAKLRAKTASASGNEPSLSQDGPQSRTDGPESE